MKSMEEKRAAAAEEIEEMLNGLTVLLCGAKQIAASGENKVKIFLSSLPFNLSLCF